MMTNSPDRQIKSEPTHAVLYALRENPGQEPTIYYVKATRGDDGRTPAAVHAFVGLRAALDHFEHAYFAAVEAGGGRSAGAMLNYIQLSPRIFSFRSRGDLVKLLGETVHVVHIHGTGILGEVAFCCTDQERAARIYAEACPPRLVPVT